MKIYILNEGNSQTSRYKLIPDVLQLKLIYQSILFKIAYKFLSPLSLSL